MEPRQVLVVGPGALGILFAARLAEAGHTVSLAVRDRKRAKQIPAHWIAVGPDGAEAAGDGEVVARRGDLRAPVDVLVLATKADDARAALVQWLPALRPDGAVVPLQNGVLGDRLADLATDRLVECTVGIPATLVAPGRSEQTGPGELVVGPWPDGRMAPATPLEAVALLLHQVAPTRVHQNMLGVKWTKLLINSAITGLGALTGQPLGRLLQDRRARTAFLHIITEGYRAGSDQGVHFEKVNRFEPGMFVVEKPRRKAAKGDRSAPVNAAVQALVHEIEAGDQVPSMDHLDALPFRFR